jgi:hypothetical protein
MNMKLTQKLTIRQVKGIRDTWSTKTTGKSYDSRRSVLKSFTVFSKEVIKRNDMRN